MDSHIKTIVCDGSSLFWTTNWLGSGILKGVGKLQHPSQTLNQAFQDRHWLPHLFENNLPPTELQRVLAASLNFSNRPDFIIWDVSDSGHFTTSSVYHLIRAATTPNQLLHFVWIAKFLWNQAQLLLNIKIATAADLLTLLHDCWTQSNSKDAPIKQLIPGAVCWTLWQNHCAAIYSRKQAATRLLFPEILKMLHGFTITKPLTVSKLTWEKFQQHSFLKMKCKIRIPRQIFWEKPLKWKFNVDGSSLGNPGYSGAGIILRNSLGEVTAAESIYLGECSSVQAELQALHLGLLLCFCLQLSEVQVEIDSLMVANWCLKNMFGLGAITTTSATSKD